MIVDTNRNITILLINISGKYESMSLHQTFATLGDPTRFAIVERLLAEGELSAGRLQDQAKISAPAISRHLKLLRNAGVIQQRIDAQRRLYSVRPETVKSIHEWTMNYKDFWAGSLENLEASLLKEKAKND
jgi:DNA-binding transcriptional ArsR family regulator